MVVCNILATYPMERFIWRNPLDVAVSWAFHNGKNTTDADKSINENMTLSVNNKYQNQLQQQLLTWKDHVDSWKNNPNIPVLMLRYEDMKLDSLATFRKAIAFLGWEHSDEEILTALQKSSFKHLKKQEQSSKFKESTQKQTAFFRRGEIGDWNNHLTAKQVQNILQFNQDILDELDYTSLYKKHQLINT